MNVNLDDIFIIGGGINGTGIAADAAGRGLSVTLCEKGDLGSGTSSASSKLIHGGVRYLENYEFGLVRKSLIEREILFKKDSHIISALEFVLPYEKKMRPAWLIQIGLWIYDRLASHPLLPNSKKINFANDIRGKELLPEIKMGFSYFDCFTDDSRLVILNAISAKNNGANILTHTSFVDATYENKRWKILLKNLLTGESYFREAKFLINVTGPWVAQIQNQIVNAAPVSVELVKGSHIVVPKIYSGNFAYILQNPDKRIVFAIPYQNDFTLIGTTDMPYKDDCDKVSISLDEENYLCATISRYFEKPVLKQNIVWSYAGVRCLQASNAARPSDITREYELRTDTHLPLLTVVGGKLTAYRVLAEQVVDSLKKFFPFMGAAWTATKSLPGGDFPPGEFVGFCQTLKNNYPWLPEQIAQRYAKSYGTLAHIILANTTCLKDLGKEFAAGLYQKEVEYLIKYEWATSTEDILWRRTKLGLYFSKEDINSLATYLTVIPA
jgi:glycerol-3-phosphate dehydrogenase